MHQRPNPIHFFFQREMARVEKMELCAWEAPNKATMLRTKVLQLFIVWCDSPFRRRTSDDAVAVTYPAQQTEYARGG